MKSLTGVVNNDNRALLYVIHEMQPPTIVVLERATRGKPSKLSRTLTTF